jgi:2-polyprenyl-6-methoxyphenol hydroxylase-like FAD-dependent oxidoreductase
MPADIMVIGSGPAGAATAIGLSRLGYKVQLISGQRQHPVTEGVSERVLGAFKHLGLQRALQTLSAPIHRTVHWNDESRSANVERLVQRQQLDQAINADLLAQGIEPLNGQVTKLEWRHQQWQAHCQLSNGQQQLITADYLVDARGRSAPLGHGQRVRGPESVTIYQNWQIPRCQPFVSVMTVANGWLWAANTGQGQLYSQQSMGINDKALNNKADIPQLLKQQLAKIPHCQTLTDDMQAIGKAGARSSTAIMPGEVITPNSIRVGDAAMAGDPLSGNGMFMGLSAALIAPAVINTQLQRPAQAELAMSFYQQRLQHLFTRFARIGRDFYQQESRWPNADYWQQRQQWPDSTAAHSTENKVLGIAHKPVVIDGWIESKEVVITSENPLGIWQIDGKNAAELLRQSGRM